MGPANDKCKDESTFSRVVNNDWFKVVVSNVCGAGVIIITLWTRQQVLMNEISHLHESVGKLEQRMDRLSDKFFDRRP